MSKKVLFPTGSTPQNLLMRDKLLTEFKKHFKDLSSLDFLEVGIGNGRFGSILAESFANYSGIDPSKEYVKIAIQNVSHKSNTKYKVGKAEKIPFDKKFDIIFYSLSWHFIKDFSRALSEAKRVLKSSGVILILEPTGSGNWASPKLNRNSPEFDEILLIEKMESLELSKFELKKQKLFKVTEKSFGRNANIALYILKTIKQGN